jgi:hypothetical protein
MSRTNHRLTAALSALSALWPLVFVAFILVAW